MLVRFGTDSNKFVLAFMICAAIVSSVISNVPTCVVFLSVVMEYLKMYTGEDEKRTGKTLMIGIPVASMIGGMITPAGSSINLLAISLLERVTGLSISFAQWMCIGIPVAVIILPLSWCLLVKAFPPAEMDRKKNGTFIKNLAIPEKLMPEEMKVISIFSVMFVFWFLSSWIPSINIMVVALLGCCVYCLPRLGVLNVREFIKSVSWDAFFLVGTVLSMGSALVNNGVSDIIIKLVPNFMGTPKVLILMCVTFITFLLLIVIPVAPSLVAFLAPVVIQIAVSTKMSPALTMMLCAICACNCYLFPLDTVCLISYSKGYYKMSDMAKITAPLQVCIVIVASFCAYVAGGMFGWL